MERERGFKVIAIIALLVAVVGASVGFAALSSTLTINAASGSVSPEDSLLAVEFSDNASTAITGGAATTLDDSAHVGDGDGTAVIAAGNIVTDITASFKAPGDSVTFEWYALNLSEDLAAYLKTITYSKTAPACAAVTPGETVANIATACTAENMSMDITVGDVTAGFGENLTNITANNEFAVNASKKITLVLTYDENAPAVDGNITVDFGSIILGFKSSNTNL